jgi:bacteriorhodopsin
MNPQLISPAVAAFFALLAAIFLVLSSTRASPPARKTWLRIGIIFALVALATFLFRPK